MGVSSQHTILGEEGACERCRPGCPQDKPDARDWDFFFFPVARGYRGSQQRAPACRIARLLGALRSSHSHLSFRRLYPGLSFLGRGRGRGIPPPKREQPEAAPPSGA
uniref:Uncharacterized protein n=1 Tax=Micrurus paraensis TaxID=1970185 RepID=A0A2D4KEW7_9SAUR